MCTLQICSASCIMLMIDWLIDACKLQRDGWKEFISRSLSLHRTFILFMKIEKVIYVYRLNEFIDRSFNESIYPFISSINCLFDRVLDHSNDRFFILLSRSSDWLPVLHTDRWLGWWIDWFVDWLIVWNRRGSVVGGIGKNCRRPG